MSIFRYLFNLLPIHRDKVVFYTFSETYADHPKYIAEELQRRKLPLKLVWISEHKRVSTPRGIRSVCGKYLSRYHLATARVIIANHRLNFYWPKGYIKKPGQTYLQTWHGSYGIKKMEADVHTPSAAYINKAKLDSRQIDYLISNSKWLTDIYRACFFYSGSILETGSPRNDLLFHPGDTAARVRCDLGLPADRKLLLFAPTFRDGAESELPPMPEFPRLRDALCKRFGGEWVILARVHPGRRKNPQPLNVADQCVRDASDWPDVTELLAAADAMITDYSSCIFDFLLTGKPAFVYAPDMTEYERTRGLYYPYSETPIPVAEDNSALIYNVENFDQEAYQAKVDDFLREKGTYDTGQATQKAVDLVQSSLAEPIPCMADTRKRVTRVAWRAFLKKFYSIKEVKPMPYKRLRILGMPVRKLRKKNTSSPARKPDYASLPIQENKIVLRSVMNGYTCNLKYIVEELLRQNLAYDIVWLIKSSDVDFLNSFPKGVRFVADGTLKAFTEFATCKIRIENTPRWGKPVAPRRNGVIKKEGQYYIQTGHGSLGIKKITYEGHGNISPTDLRYAQMDAKDQDYLISNSTWEADLYRRVFWNNGKIVNWGHPRNDIFFRGNRNDIRKKVYNCLGIPENFKLVLYAPTWRDDKNLAWCILNYEELLSALSKKFGGEWGIALRMHHLMYAYCNRLIANGNQYYNASSYADIQELLVAADVFVTDYSSCMFDFMLSRRPAFLYTPDHQEYEKTRGFYYPLSETPFPIADTNESLISNIERFDEKAYIGQCNDFLEKKGCIEDGYAAERVVELIKQIAPLSSY